MKTALLFSGQGSQYVGMIRDIYEKYPPAAEYVDRADQLTEYKLSEICFDGPSEVLKETRYTQPAIFLHSVAAFKMVENSLDFHSVAGHSVGEYAALFAAGVIEFEDAIKLVSLRGRLMFSAGDRRPGTMFAVINLEDEIVRKTAEEISSENGIVVAANYNSPGQVVVSGDREFLRENISAFKEAGARIVKELPVSGAFHSPLMEPARETLAAEIENVRFVDAKVPVYSNVSAEPVKEAAQIKKNLVSQLTSPVLWTQTLMKMKENNFENFIEIGPGNVLQGLVKRTLRGSKFSGIDKAEDIENIIN